MDAMLMMCPPLLLPRHPFVVHARGSRTLQLCNEHAAICTFCVWLELALGILGPDALGYDESHEHLELIRMLDVEDEDSLHYFSDTARTSCGLSCVMVKGQGCMNKCSSLVAASNCSSQHHMFVVVIFEAVAVVVVVGWSVVMAVGLLAVVAVAVAE